MMPDQKAYDFIRSFEGCILHPYKDSKGKPTIGIGCTMYKTGKSVTMADPPITQAQAIELFQWQVGLKAAAVNGLHILFNQNEFNAVLSLCYNIGITNLTKSSVVRLARQNTKNPDIRRAFMMWNEVKILHPDGTKEILLLASLTARREREADLYFTPVTV